MFKGANKQTNKKQTEEKKPYLQVLMHAPRCCLSIVHRLDRGLCDAGYIPPGEYPRLTGGHGNTVHVRQLPAVHLDRGQGTDHCNNTMTTK